MDRLQRSDAGPLFEPVLRPGDGPDRDQELQIKYLTCCVDSTAGLIDDLIESEEEITLAAFREEAEGFEDWCSAKGYSDDCLKIDDDWHVSFHRSVYDGEPCIYVQWSGIEFIWTESGEGAEFGYGNCRT